jgi:superfamily II DNA or RNA helicase
LQIGIKFDLFGKKSTLSEIKFAKIIQLLKENKMFLQKLRNYLKNKIIEDNCVKNSWAVRDYQTEAINHGYQLLLQDKKFYLELPTGGGKSYIVYNILKSLTIEIDLILIISPRKIVNSQNVSEKYVNLLNKPCNIYNYSNDKCL